MKLPSALSVAVNMYISMVLFMCAPIVHTNSMKKAHLLQQVQMFLRIAMAQNCWTATL